jgi:hypothetical protein
MAGFEPTASRPPAVRATKLRHIPSIKLYRKFIPHGHVPRPRNFTIESIAFIGRFPCEAPLALLTPGVRAIRLRQSPIQIKSPAVSRGLIFLACCKVGVRSMSPRRQTIKTPVRFSFRKILLPGIPQDISYYNVYVRVKRLRRCAGTD